MSWSSNIDEIIKRLDKKDTAMMAAASRGLVKGMYEFEAKIVKEQLSGRPGLKSVSGKARNSFVINVQGSGESTVVTMATRAWYLAVHNWINFKGYIYPKNKKYLQFRIGKKFITTKSVYIPKRLSIPETFKKEGPAILRKRILSSCVDELVSKK